MKDSIYRTRPEDINTLAVVGEVGALIAEGGSTNSNGLLSSGGRIVAGIPVIVSCFQGGVRK